MSAGGPNDFDGVVALVTGAAQGIGAAVVDALGAAGAAVAAVDRQPAPTPARGRAYRADVTDSAAVERTVTAVEADLGPIEVLVNVAGVLHPAHRAVDLSEVDWQRSLAVNATGVFLLSTAVARRMTPRGRGSIVTVGSNAAGVPRTAMAGYAASKAAAAQFTRCLGLELAPLGIRCNVVSPGSTDTPMLRAMWTDDADTAARRVVEGTPAEFRTGIPLGRLAEPADVAAAVLFLASPAARHVTMHDLYVDGGATLHV